MNAIKVLTQFYYSASAGPSSWTHKKLLTISRTETGHMIQLQYLHNQNGKIEVGEIDPNWASALWKVQ